MALPFEKPSALLMREYEAVARRAGNLRQRFDRPNFSTDNLPLEAMKTLLAALCLLPKGTAEGGRIQLIEAQDQLGDIRSTYVSLDPTNIANAHGAPKLQRDDPLDEELGALLGAVVTALATANREAGAQMVDPKPAQHHTNEPQAQEVADAITQGSETVESIHAARKTAQQVLDPVSQPADTLKRRLADSEGLTLAGSASLKAPSVVSRWSRRISEALKKSPALLRSAANCIETAHDVLKPFYNQWKDLEKDLENTISVNIIRFASNLRIASNKLEFKNIFILICDSEKSITNDIKAHLNDEGYNTIEKTSAFGAINFIINDSRNVKIAIISDYYNEIEVIQFVNALIEAKESINIIYLPATNQVNLAGYKNVITIFKPFKYEELIRAVQTTINR